MSRVTEEREVKHIIQNMKQKTAERTFLGFKLSLDRIGGVDLFFFLTRGRVTKMAIPNANYDNLLFTVTSRLADKA